MPYFTNPYTLDHKSVCHYRRKRPTIKALRLPKTFKTFKIIKRRFTRATRAREECRRRFKNSGEEEKGRRQRVG
jgi:hypothetical protein